MRSPVAFVIVSILAIGLGVWLSRGPWQVFVVQNSQRRQAVTLMRTRQLEASDLQRKKLQYECPLGKETLAREKGYVGPGEKLVSKS